MATAAPNAVSMQAAAATSASLPLRRCAAAPARHRHTAAEKARKTGRGRGLTIVAGNAGSERGRVGRGLEEGRKGAEAGRVVAASAAVISRELTPCGSKA